MHAKTVLKMVAPLLAALCLSLTYGGTTFAAPGSSSTVQQGGGQPDCSKTPTDPRCSKD